MFEKTLVTIPNRLYGDATYHGYEKQNLFIAKVRKKYSIVWDGNIIWSGLDRPTLKEAKALVDKLLTLDVDWANTSDHYKSKVIAENLDFIKGLNFL